MNEICYVILFSTLAGTVSYLIWKKLACKLQEKNKLKCIYPMLLVTVGFYLIPVFYLVIKLLLNFNKQNLSFESLFLWTPSIQYSRTPVVAVWVIGMVISTIYLARDNMKVNKHLISIFPAEPEVIERKDKIAKELGLRQNISVYRGYGVSSPIVSGVFQKKIYLPVEDFEDKEQEVILYHEMVHIKQYVVGVKAFVSILQVIHWFNPIVRDFLHSLDEWGETACDIYVRYDTECNVTFREYFGYVAKRIKAEDDDEDIPDTATYLAKIEGVSERVDMIKNYKRDKDFKLLGGILTMAAFISLSTTTSLATGAGIEYVHNAIYEMTDDEVMVSMAGENEAVETEYIEFEDTSVVGEEDMIEMPSLQPRNNSFLFDSDVPVGKLGYSQYFNVSAGGKITLTVSVKPDDVSIKAGIIYPDGSKVYVRGSDSIYYRFSVEKAGKYRIYIDNDSDTPVTVSGSVLYE